MDLDRNQISSTVREHLGRRPFDDVSIEVLEDLMRRENDWCYVPVRPSHRLQKTSPYYELLAMAEEELDEEKGLNVLLAHTLPEE